MGKLLFTLENALSVRNQNGGRKRKNMKTPVITQRKLGRKNGSFRNKYVHIGFETLVYFWKLVSISNGVTQ